MNNWFEFILYNTRAQPETSAILMEDRVVTYGMLGAAIENCARRITALDIDRNGVVAVLNRNPIRNVTLCLALYRIGIRSMTVEPGQTGSAKLKFAAVLGEEGAKQFVDSANRIIETSDAWFGPEPVGGGPLPDYFLDDDEECRQSLTSGTTGAPKIIGNTVGLIGRHVVPGTTMFNCNFVLCMLGLSSTWGFTTACATLASKKTLCFAASPAQAIRMIDLFSIDFVLAATDQVISLARAARKSGAHLQNLATIVTGGGIVTSTLLEAAALYLCKDTRCQYGSSEVGLLGEATAGEVLGRPGFVGHIYPGFEVCIFDAKGEPCRPGNPGLVKGRRKRASRSDPECPWISLDDIGWLTADSALYITGRTSDVRVASNCEATPRSISPVYEVEHLLRLEWDAADVAAVSVDDVGGTPEFWIATVDCKDARADKFEAVLQRRGIDGKVRLFPVASIPRGASGKVQRAELKSVMLASVKKAESS